MKWEGKYTIFICHILWMGRLNSCEMYVKILHSSSLRTEDRAKRITLFRMPLQVGLFQTRTFHMRVKGTCETNVKTYENVWNGSIICDNNHLFTLLSWRLSLINLKRSFHCLQLALISQLVAKYTLSHRLQMFASGSDLKGHVGFFHLPSLVSHAEVLIQVIKMKRFFILVLINVLFVESRVFLSRTDDKLPNLGDETDNPLLSSPGQVRVIICILKTHY